MVAQNPTTDGGWTLTPTLFLLALREDGKARASVSFWFFGSRCSTAGFSLCREPASPGQQFFAEQPPEGHGGGKRHPAGERLA